MPPETQNVRLIRLEERLTGVRDRLDRIDRDVATFGPVAGQVIEVVAEVRLLVEDVGELKDELKTEKGMSVALRVALIGGSVALLTALIAAVAQILSAG